MVYGKYSSHNIKEREHEGIESILINTRIAVGK